MKSETRRGEPRGAPSATGTAASVLIYLTLTGVLGFVHYGLVDVPNAKTRATYHEQVVNAEAPAPIQHRLLIPLAAEGIHHVTGLTVPDTYVLLRGLATFLNLVLFHVLLARWLPSPWPLTGTLFLAAITPLLYLGAQFQEGDHWNLTAYLAALLVLAARRDGWLWPLILVAMLNREDAVYFPLLYLLARYDELPAGALLLRAGGLATLALGVYGGLRVALGTRAWYSEFMFIQQNLSDPMAYAMVALTFGLFGLIAWRGLANRPAFWRRMGAALPFLLLTRIAFTQMQEARNLIPLVPIVLPLGLLAMASRAGVAPPADPRLSVATTPFRERPGAWLSLLAVAFLAAFGLFVRFGQRTYQAGFDHRREAVQHYLEAKRLAKAGDRAGVIAALRRAITAAPESTVAAAARKRLERITAPTP